MLCLAKKVCISCEEWAGALSSCSCHTLRMDKSSVKMECTEPVLILTSSASSRTVTRRSCMTKVRTWSRSSSFRLVEGLPGTSVAIHRRAAIFGWVVPLFNPLNPELNPICYLLALLAHHFLHVSRIMVKSLPLRLLMSYIQGGTGGMCQTSGGCSLC